VSVGPLFNCLPGGTPFHAMITLGMVPLLNMNAASKMPAGLIAGPIDQQRPLFRALRGCPRRGPHCQKQHHVRVALRSGACRTDPLDRHEVNRIGVAGTLDHVMYRQPCDEISNCRSVAIAAI